MFLIGAILFACAPKPVEPKVKPSVPEAPVKILEAKEPWQWEWEKIQSFARKEGILTIYTLIKPETRVALSKVFKDKFGINLEIIVGSPPEMVERILAQRRAGLFAADVYVTGPDTAWAHLKPIGALESPEKYLLLPEVMDPQVWWGGKILWMDKDRTFLQFFAYPSVNRYINTDMVRPGEITSYNDLLHTKWKSKKIVLGDPLLGRSFGLTLFHIVEYAMGWDYMRALTKQEPVISRDERQMVEWVARGKYPIAIGAAQMPFFLELKNVGLPIEVLSLKEGAPLTQGTGAITVLEKAPHPNAIKVFLNWILTREGQTLLSRYDLAQSARLDVPIDHLPEYYKRQPEVNYVNLAQEEIIKKQYESRIPLAEILGIR